MNSLKKIKKNILAAIAPGILIGAMFVIGYYTKNEHGFLASFEKFLLMLAAVAVCIVLTAILYTWIDGIKKNYFTKKERKIPWVNIKIKSSGLYFVLMAVFLLIIWMPSFFAFYPGIYAYDASWQYDMYRSGAVTPHHPILHTYLLGSVIDFAYKATGSFNKGVVAYTLLQMILMALGCAYVFYLLHKRKEPVWMHVLALLFFGFYPPFVIFVFTSTKDSIFAIAVADFFLLNLSLFENKKSFFEKKSNMVMWIIFALLILILRNNAIYAALVTLPFLVVTVVKSDCKKSRAFTMLGITVLLFLIYKYPINNAFSEGSISKAEMLSVPCQQIMRVYKYKGDRLSGAQKEKVERFFDDSWKGYYVPEIADATKGSLVLAEYELHKDEFYSLWFELLKEYPGEYIDSFFENTYTFWYPAPHYIIYSFGGEGYTPILCMQPAEQNSKLPVLLSFYKNFENGALVQSKRAVSWLFAPATFLYIVLLLWPYLIKERGTKLCVPFVFLALLWCTYLLGPVAMVRYSLYLYALLPVWPAYLWHRNG